MKANMKKKILLFAGFLLVIALLASCAGRQNPRGESAVNDAFVPFIEKTQDDREKEEMPGSRDEYTDPSAAKFITSKDIISFKCEFECSYLWETSYSYCIFDLERKDDDALCKIQTFRDLQIISNLEFQAPLSALDGLQAMIDEHKLMKHNGIFNHTNGLPEGYGVSLSVDYASGERLSFQDNQDVIISEKATAALHDFFRDVAQDAGYSLFADEEKDMEDAP